LPFLSENESEMKKGRKGREKKALHNKLKLLSGAGEEHG
jgi:hypothetical protein